MARRGVRVGGVVVEEALLVLPRVDELLALVDVLLAAVDHAHVAQRPAAAVTQPATTLGDTPSPLAPLEQLRRVRAAVHQVELGEHTQRAPALRIDLPRDGDRVGVGQVGVGGGDGEHDAVGPLHVLEHHLLDLQPDVIRLVAHGVLGDARQVDERQQGWARAPATMRGGGCCYHNCCHCCHHCHTATTTLILAAATAATAATPLVGAALPLGVRLNLGADRRVGSEALAGQVRELCVLCALGLQHHEHERPACDDAAPARQEGAADDVLEHRRLAATLRSHHAHLRQVDR
eukprot:scaffold71645_cov66-Phaeocystis_antarctica.AAC.6